MMRKWKKRQNSQFFISRETRIFEFNSNWELLFSVFISVKIQKRFFLWKKVFKNVGGKKKMKSNMSKQNKDDIDFGNVPIFFPKLVEDRFSLKSLSTLMKKKRSFFKNFNSQVQMQQKRNWLIVKHTGTDDFCFYWFFRKLSWKWLIHL